MELTFTFFFLISYFLGAHGFEELNMQDIPDQIKSPPKNISKFKEAEEFASTVTFKEMEYYIERAYPGAGMCYMLQKEFHIKFSTKFAEKMDEAAKDISNNIDAQYKYYAQRAQAPMKNTGKTVKQLGKKMESTMKRSFRDTVLLMRKSRQSVASNEEKFNSIMKDLRRKSPECADKAEERVKKIREEAKRESKIITEGFRKCVRRLRI